MKIALIGGETAHDSPLVAFAQEDGHEIVGADDTGADAIWWLGAATDEPDSATLAMVERQVGQEGRPYLGCEAGHSGLALALGGACDARLEEGAREVMLTEVGATGVLLDGVAEPMRLSGGPDRCISRLPDGARCLATSERCPVEAMIWGTRAFSTHAVLGAAGGFDEAAAERIYINWYQAAAKA